MEVVIAMVTFLQFSLFNVHLCFHFHHSFNSPSPFFLHLRSDNAHVRLDQINLKATMSYLQPSLCTAQQTMELNHIRRVPNNMQLIYKISFPFSQWARQNFWHFFPVINMISNDMPAVSSCILRIPLILIPTKNVCFCFIYFNQSNGKDIVNVHLYHKWTYVYTFLKTSPVFPLYRLPTVW